METKNNPFGNSIGIIGDGLFSGRKGELIEKIAFHIADIGGGSMHFLGVSEASDHFGRKCDSVIALSGDAMGTLRCIHARRVVAEQDTPVVHINFEPAKMLPFNHVNLGRLPSEDVLMMDLVSPNFGKLGNQETGFLLRQFGQEGNPRKVVDVSAQCIATRIADLLTIPIVARRDNRRMWNDSRTDDCGVLMPWARGPF